MVNAIKKALAGFILVPGGSRTETSEIPFDPQTVIVRGCSLRGVTDKEKKPRFLVLTGREESDILRRLRDVVVGNEEAPARASARAGVNLVLFRGVFGSGGYGVEVRSVTRVGAALEIECDFEDPGDGIRTTAGCTQPAAIVPLKPLPPGKYHARVKARQLTRSSQGVREASPSREWASLSFKLVD